MSTVLYRMRKEITHDMHRMKAFVRFRKVGDRYIAWHRPDHLDRREDGSVVRRAFRQHAVEHPHAGSKRALGSAKTLVRSGRSASEAPAEDALEELWRAYYASTFNPARVNEKLLRNHVPARYWAAMPETRHHPGSDCRGEGARAPMCETKPISAADFIPRERDSCQCCASRPRLPRMRLYERATQPVFGQGPANARIVLVGEQPGDQEDLTSFSGGARTNFQFAGREKAEDPRQAIIDLLPLPGRHLSDSGIAVFQGTGVVGAHRSLVASRPGS